mgnify:CR=1 FL=1
MKLEVYQILVPLAALGFMVNLFRRFLKSRASWQEALLGGSFWLSVGVFALFPDAISNWLARLFGIKSNINAIIFFCLGLIFFFQYKLFFLLKRNQMAITELARKITLERAEKEDAQS